MSQEFKNFFWTISITIFSIVLYGQEIPPIQIFTPQDYGAEDQNWAISQSLDKSIYIANNKGLLQYNGASWQLFTSPNGTILRSVLCGSERIYTGAYMDFGYWSRNEFNTLNYTSIVEEFGIEVKEDEEFWGIQELDNYIIFQSFDRIYICDNKVASCVIIDATNRINRIFKVSGEIYFQDMGLGIFKIENGQSKLIIPSAYFEANEIIDVYENDGELLLVTKKRGLFRYSTNQSENFGKEVNALLKDRTLYSARQLADGSLILGTISNGIIQVSSEGKVLLEINQYKGLSNNTVLAVFEDKDGNIWLGMDNGINVINLRSPFKVYTDKLGQLGTVYASILFEGNLYLGTNQGLFYKPQNVDKKFKLVPGTNGQVWSLNIIDNRLFCGHDIGTYIIEDENADLIASIKGTWGVKQISSHANLLLQGNYKGLHILKKENNDWKYDHKLDGFDISSRYFDFVSNKEILVSHEYKGVYRISIDENFRKVLKYDRMEIPSGVKSSIISYNGTVYYISKDGAYKFNFENESFVKDSVLSRPFSNDNYHSGKLIEDSVNNRLWGFTKDEIIYIEPGLTSSAPEVNQIPLPKSLRKDKAGFENILHLQGEKYLVGTTTGYFIMDLAKMEKKQNQILLDAVTVNEGHDLKELISLEDGTKLLNSQNTIQFSYSVPSFNGYSNTQYQYILEGLYDSWSNWSSQPSVTFENLPYGHYIFKVRGKTGGTTTQNVITYEFTINKPWYLQPLAIIGYVLSFLLVVGLLHLINRNYYKQQKKKLLKDKERERELEKLENQKQIVEFKNENLQLDIENKNRELGIATMNLVKRNELLSEIKTALSKTKSIEEVKKVTKMINKNLNDSNDWKLFEEAFNNVDKDFMKRVKGLHPSVTPNDLRLCAYLRLNLSSKEIAPLLNISHKSVEVKRYRLRKKMGLDHDRSLTNYILEL